VTQLHHVVAGDDGAPPVVFGNSLGSTLEMWDAQAEALCGRFRVVRYDARGHGGSPVPPGPYTIDDLGGDLLELLDALELDRASLCGLSLGGMSAMWLAAHAPERVDRLVLVCTSPLLGPREMWDERAAMVRERGTEAVADGVVGRWFTPAFAEREPDLVARMRAMVAATPREGYAACCEALRDMDLRTDLASVVAPTLVIGGADDPSTPPDEHARPLAEAIAGAGIVVLEHAAHLANVEQADEVTRLISEHLTKEDTR
jgi:3-oxoadipate enol-lactonase